MTVTRARRVVLFAAGHGRDSFVRHCACFDARRMVRRRTLNTSRGALV